MSDQAVYRLATIIETAIDFATLAAILIVGGIWLILFKTGAL